MWNDLMAYGIIPGVTWGDLLPQQPGGAALPSSRRQRSAGMRPPLPSSRLPSPDPNAAPTPGGEPGGGKAAAPKTES